MKRILLLEDDAALGRSIRMTPENTDKAVTLRGTLSEARQVLGKERFSC